jgi:tRNA dimethylallyltransferase
MKKLPKLLVIIGPTASGKTKLAVNLARLFNGEIVSADSRQVYKGMDIGTGKDLVDYGKGENQIKYHMIDIADPVQQFDLKSYQTKAYQAIESILKKKKLPILVGGSGLYVQAVVDGYQLINQKSSPKKTQNLSLQELQNIISNLDPKFLNRLNESDQKNKRRLERYLEIMEQSATIHTDLHEISKPHYKSLVIALNTSLVTVRKNIKQRLESRLKEGMIEEVQALHLKGLSWERLISFGLEYKYITLFLKKEISRKEMKERIYIASGQFAKRQMTWFRRWEKQGREIMWIKPKSIKKITKLVSDFLKKN